MHFVVFEDKVHIDHTSFIDAYIPSTHVMIEQKSLGKDLRKPIKQSDGSLLTPFQQAKRYSSELPYSSRPRWIITCNFSEFLIYDMEKPQGEPVNLLWSLLLGEGIFINFAHTTFKWTSESTEVAGVSCVIVGFSYKERTEKFLFSNEQKKTLTI